MLRKEAIETAAKTMACGALNGGGSELNEQPPLAFIAGMQTGWSSTVLQLQPDGHWGSPGAQERLQTGARPVSARQLAPRQSVE
jgi:hypothetical protein